MDKLGSFDKNLLSEEKLLDGHRGSRERSGSWLQHSLTHMHTDAHTQCSNIGFLE